MYKILGLILVLAAILGIAIINRDSPIFKKETQIVKNVASKELAAPASPTEPVIIDKELVATATAQTYPAEPVIKNIEKKQYSVDYTKIIDSDIILGDKEAKNYIIIYTSLTCPHCSDFYNKVFPIIKAELIDTHKIAYVNRSFLSDRVAIAGTMLAFCNGKEEYYTMLKVLFAKSSYWVMDSNYLQALEKIASLAGISPAKFEQCLANKELQESLFLAQKEAVDQLNVHAIPVIIINGNQYQGALPYEKIKEKLILQ